MKEKSKTQKKRAEWLEDGFSEFVLVLWCILFCLCKEKLFSHVVIREKIWNRASMILIYMFVMVILKLLVDRYWARKTLFWVVIIGTAPVAVILCIRWFAEGSRMILGVIAMILVYTVVLLRQMVGGGGNRIQRNRRWAMGMQRILGCFCLMSLFGGALGCIGLGSEQNVLPEVVDAAESNIMRANADYLRLWKTKNYDQLTEQEKMELFQKFADLECQYLGIEPVCVEKEKYDSDTKRGCYIEYGRILSISSKLLDADRADAMETLLHECHHAYAQDLVNYVSINEADERSKLLAYREVYNWKDGFEQYVNADDNYEAYYLNPVEVAAREYARERMAEYMEFIDWID